MGCTEMSNERRSESEAKQDLVVTRVFDAPVEDVWRAWSDGEHVMHRWGPKGFTSPACKMDFREGGKYIFHMRASESEDLAAMAGRVFTAPASLRQFNRWNTSSSASS